MDALTAGVALVITQLCVALVLIGAYVAAPQEKCTGYWAWAATCIAAGVLLLVVNGGASRYLLQLAANTLLILGGILQLCGLQAFYRRPVGNLGWIVGAVFLLLFLLLGAIGAPIALRVTLFALTLLALLVLSCRVLLAGMHAHWTFGRAVTLGAIGLLMVNNVVRIAASIGQDPDYLPMTRAAAGITILYLVPLAGTLLYAIGLLLLYFERLVDDKNHLATHDDLTGVLNRRAIVAAGEREVAVAIRSRQALTVAFVDIDHFKRVNDSLGHEAGDRVLVEIVQLFKAACRNIDLVGRYGGEEFCIIFPGVDHDRAAILGDRLLSAVRQYRFHNQHPITVSVGFASLPASDGERSWASLIRRADSALYQAKGLGRDRFCVAAVEHETPAHAAPAPAAARYAVAEV